MIKLEEYKQKLKDDIAKCEELKGRYIKEQSFLNCLDKKDSGLNRLTCSQKLNAIRLYIDELNKELHRIEINERYKETDWND
jgi:hypothetical protein